MRGSRSKGIPGGWTRRGPIHANGLARSENTGSMRRLVRAVRTRNVAWPIHVTTTSFSSRGTGGAAGVESGTARGQGFGLDVNRHRKKSDLDRSGTPAWKKVFPLKWSEGASVIGATL
jgi:hypothetical protein